MLCSCVTTVLMFLFFFSSSSYRDDVSVIKVKEMTLSFYPAMPVSSEITPIAMFLDQRPCYVLAGGQRVVHTFGGVLVTGYWMMLPEALSYKISNRWVIQLRWIILEDQFWRSVKIRSDGLYPRDLASLFQSSYTYTSLRGWDAGRGRSPV